MDTFVVSVDQNDRGVDRITDYTNADIIDITAFGITDGAVSNQDWRDATTRVIDSFGVDFFVTIYWVGSGRTILEKTAASDLTDDDFAF